MEHQLLLPGWAVREPRRSIRSRRQLMQPLSVLIASYRSKSLGKTQVHEEKSMLNNKKHRKREQEVTKGPIKRIKIKDTENLELKGQDVTKGPVKHIKIKDTENQKMKEQEVTKGPVKRTKIKDTENMKLKEQEVTKGPVKRTKIKDTENLKLKGPTSKPHTSSPLKKPTKQKEPAENIKAGGNIESLHNKELQISARTEAEPKKKRERKTELALIKAEIKQIREEQERMNLELSARREEQLKEIANRKKELHILNNNIISLRNEQNKLMSMHIQGEGSRQKVICMSTDTEVLEVSTAGQEVVTSGETHVQQVSSSEQNVLEKRVASGETHVPEMVSTSLPALEEDTFVLPDLNNPFVDETS